jgi:hypothetical protein
MIKKVNTKKIIAREFLYFISTSIIISLIYLGLILYNHHYKNKIIDTLTEFKTTTLKHHDFINKPIPIKNSSLLKQYVDTANSGKYETWDKINSKFPDFKDADKGVLEEYVATVNSKKYSNWNEINSKFPEYFQNKSDADSLKNFENKLTSLRDNEINYKDKTLSDTDIINTIFLVIKLLLFLAFGVRYLFYATMWSIRTIQND